MVGAGVAVASGSIPPRVSAHCCVGLGRSERVAVTVAPGRSRSVLIQSMIGKKGRTWGSVVVGGSCEDREFV